MLEARRKTRSQALLTATAVIELPTGVALLAAPSWVAELLLGEGLGSGAAMVVGRVAGAALLALGLSCWAEIEHPKTSGLPIGMLIYNGAVAFLLAHAARVGHMHGPVLWPAVVLHALLTLWCAARLVRRPLRASA